MFFKNVFIEMFKNMFFVFFICKLMFLTSMARLALDNSSSLEKFELGQCPPQPPLRRNFGTRSEFLLLATRALNVTFLAPLTSQI